EAVQIAKAALVRAEASESGWFLCTAHTTLGRLFTRSELRDDACAEAHLLAALRHAEGMESRPLCAHALLALGELLGGKTARGHKRNGTISERNRAREYLTRAVDLAGTLGIHTVRGHAAGLLARLEGRPARQRGKGGEGR
ncbi:MAG TPA: hypothetical protein VKJ47_01260, partial [Candidatus Binatia bacterium]|nr:hypothetical protein [Candidatus Binatia bacterium]